MIRQYLFESPDDYQSCETDYDKLRLLIAERLDWMIWDYQHMTPDNYHRRLEQITFEAHAISHLAHCHDDIELFAFADMLTKDTNDDKTK